MTVLAFGFAVGGGLFPPIAASPADEPRNTATQHIEVRRFVWPVYISPNSSSASSVCAALKPADILVEELASRYPVTNGLPRGRCGGSLSIATAVFDGEQRPMRRVLPKSGSPFGPPNSKAEEEEI